MLVFNDVEYGSVFCAPGAREFFGGGYRFHRYWIRAGMTWEKTTFVAKTMTIATRPGNMPTENDGMTPRELFPRCVIVKPLSGHVLNAVGLTNPGAEALLTDGRWQADPAPLLISFSAVGDSLEERIKEYEQFVDLAKRHLGGFISPVAIQLNFGCPNLDQLDLLADKQKEIPIALERVARLTRPVIANFGVAADFQLIKIAADHPDCHALWIANTVPWGDRRIDWKKLFGSDQSPLVKRGFTPGGLSGPACFQLAEQAVWRLRNGGVTKPIVAGNGIQSVLAVRRLHRADVDAIAIGSIGIVRPWRMRSVIQEANRLFGSYPTRRQR